MAVHRNVCDDSVATSMRINNVETVQKRVCVLVRFQPVRQGSIIQALFMFPCFNSDTIDFTVPFIVVSGDVLGGEVEETADTSLFQVLHLIQGFGVVYNFTEFPVTVSPLREIGKYVCASLVLVCHLHKLRIMIAGRIMILVFPLDRKSVV